MSTRRLRKLVLIGCLTVGALLLPALAWSQSTAPPDASTDHLVWSTIATVNQTLLPAGQTQQAKETVLQLQTYALSADAQAYTHYLLALAASYEDDYPTALAHYQEMQDCNGSLATLIGGLDGEVTTLMLAGDYAEATNAAEALIATIRPTDLPQAQEYRAGAAYQVGAMLYRQGRYVEALAQFRQVVADYAGTSWVAAAQARVDELNTSLNGGAR